VEICVALCTFNGENYLEAQLGSIEAQSRLPDRLVLVDDGSADGTFDLARRFAASASFPVELHRNPERLGHARNFGRAIGLADAEVVVLADQDDVWHPAKLARIAREFDADAGVGLVFSDAELVDSELRPRYGRLWPSVGLSAAEQREVRSGRAFEVFVRGCRVTGATAALRGRYRELVLPITAPDHDAWIALLVAAVAGVRAIPEPLVRYRQHASNQIGARPLSLAQRLERARAQRTDGLEKRRALLAQVRSRLEERGALGVATDARLDEAIRHLDARAGLPGARAGRLPTIARELLGRRYHRASEGLRSALRDLVA
jgi:hypothetical protein